MLISVIVPVYKVEKYIRPCVDSILAQTHRELDIILVDDGSPDTCGAICDEYAAKDARIRVIHKENGGGASARNAALAVAKGDYIGFIDSDDIAHPRLFETLLSMMDGVDLAICGHQTIWNDEQTTMKAVHHPTQTLDENGLWDEVFGRLNNATWNKLYRKDLLGDMTFPQGMTHGEDLIFNLQYLCKCKTGAINRTPLYLYRKRADSVTTAKFSHHKLMEIDSKDKALEMVREHKPSHLSYAQKYCFRARMNVIRAIYKAGLEEQYTVQLQQYRAYVCEHYRSVQSTLRLKEKIEFFLCKNLHSLYKRLYHS